MGDLCLLLFNLSPATVWPVEYTGNDAAPVSRSRPEEIGIFYFLSVEIFTLGTHLPCCKEAPSHMERPCVDHRWAPSQSLCRLPATWVRPHQPPTEPSNDSVLAFVWLQPHESLPQRESCLIEPSPHTGMWGTFLSYCARYLLGPFNLEIRHLQLWEIFLYYFFHNFFRPHFGSMSAPSVNQMWDLMDWVSKPLQFVTC